MGRLYDLLFMEDEVLLSNEVVMGESEFDEMDVVDEVVELSNITGVFLLLIKTSFLVIFLEFVTVIYD